MEGCAWVGFWRFVLHTLLGPFHNIFPPAVVWTIAQNLPAWPLFYLIKLVTITAFFPSYSPSGLEFSHFGAAA